MTNINLNLIKLCLDETIVRRLAGVRHVFIHSSDQNLNKVLDVFKVAGGVFGKEPLFDLAGQPYIKDSEDKVFDDFNIWGSKYNQPDVGLIGSISSPTGFVMVVDVGTKPNVLKELFERSYKSDGYIQFEKTLLEVINLIDKLEWCYVPLSNEINLAVILLSDSKSLEFADFRGVFPEASKVIVMDDELKVQSIND